MQSAAVLRTADSPSASHFSWAASFDCITGPRTTSYRMIGTFWNLCRACPSMPVDKLHSEYRSTYRWHEYTGPRQEVVRKPPQPVAGNKEEEENKNIENKIAPPPTLGGGIEPQLPRRKKNPSLAYRSHDLLTRRDNDSTSLDRARCAERRGAERERTGRRSKSEGPPQQAPSSPPVQSRVLRSDSDPSQFAQDLMCNLPSEGGGLKQAISRISTEYRLQFAWPRGKRTTEEESTGPPRKSLSMGAIKPTVQNQQLSSVGQQIQNQPAPVHKKRITQADKNAGTAELEPLVSNHEDYSGEEKIIQESFSKGEKLNLSDNIEFKTEYKKKFRPFSQYDYIDGRFKPKKEPEPQILPEVDNEHGTWFSEVIELRKKAGEYKHRGWGTELVPEHIAELYNKQISLWEQVSRRSSLSALSLASSTHHRHISKEEKEKENNKKSSPTKALWSEQVARVNQKNEKDGTPRSRIDHFIRHHLERTTGVGEEGILHSPTREKLEPVIIRRKDTTPDSSSRSPQKVQTGRSQSAGPNTTGGEKCSPKRASRPPHPPKTAPTEKKQRPRDIQTSAEAPEKASRRQMFAYSTLDTAPSRTKPKTGSNKGATAKVPMPSGTRVKQNLTDSQSTPKEKAGDEVDSSEAEILEPVVKSPPEPTRVKSPEQVLMRSPEPVNWTVPLDTGKTFTVTQNVSEGESLCRPQSESRVRSEAEAPPAPPQSAPPALSQDTDLKKEAEEEKKKLLEKPVPGTTLRCLDDPSFTFDSSSHEPKPSTDVLEKAQSRFDQFWGKTNQENMDNQGQA